jgi:hypothetical protein
MIIRAESFRSSMFPKQFSPLDLTSIRTQLATLQRSVFHRINLKSCDYLTLWEGKSEAINLSEGVEALIYVAWRAGDIFFGLRMRQRRR